MPDWTSSPVRELLGSCTDEAVAAELGCTRSAVTRNRNALGIPAYGHGVDYAAMAPDLGQMTDAEVAERHGCSTTTVFHARHRAGVPPYRQTSRSTR